MTSTPELRSTFVSQKVTDKIAALPDDQPYYTFEVSTDLQSVPTR